MRPEGLIRVLLTAVLFFGGAEAFAGNIRDLHQALQNEFVIEVETRINLGSQEISQADSINQLTKASHFWHKMFASARNAPTTELAIYAAFRAGEILVQSQVAGFTISVYDQQVLQSMYARCESLSQCQQHLNFLNPFVILMPLVARKIIIENLIPQMNLLIEKQGSQFSWSLISSSLLYQARSAAALALFYDRIGFNQSSRWGSIPFMSNQFRAEIYSELQAMEEYTSGLFPQDFDRLLNENGYENAFFHDLTRSFQTDIEFFWGKEKASQQAQGLVRSLKLTRAQNESMALYIERLGKGDPREFLESVIERWKSKQISWDGAMTTLLRFYRPFEMWLPSRGLWIQKTREVLNSGAQPEEQKYLMAQMVQWPLQVSNTLNEKLKQFQFEKETAYRLLQNEHRIAAQNNKFPSLWKMLNDLEASSQNLADAMALFDTSPSEEMYSKIYDHLEEASEKWLTLQCLSVAAMTPIERAKMTQPFRIPFMEDESQTFTLASLCQEDGDTHLQWAWNRPFEWKMRTMHARVMKPAKLKALIDLSMIPLALVSGGAASVVSRWAVQAMARSLIVRNVIIQKTLHHAVGAAAMSTTFAATNRVGMHLISGGKAPLYDRQKSLWENYGMELSFGAAFYFVGLPVTSWTMKSTQAIETKMALKTVSGKQINEIGQRIAMDTATFLPVGMIQHKMAMLSLSENEKKMMQDPGVAASIQNSILMALAFRLTFGAYR